MTKLGRDAEAARQEAARLQAMVMQREKALTDARREVRKNELQEKEKRQVEKEELEQVAAKEHAEKERLAQEKARLQYQLQARETELCSLTKELQEAKDAKADAESNARELKEEKQLRQGYEEGSVLPEWQSLSKGLQRAQHTRRAMHGILANLEGALNEFRRHEAAGELDARLIEASVVVSASTATATPADTAAAVPAGTTKSTWEVLTQDIRRLLGNAMRLYPCLLDEIEAGKRESEVLSTELEDLLARVRGGVSRYGSSPSTLRPDPHRLRRHTTAAAAAAIAGRGGGEGGGGGAAEKKLQLVDHVADQTAHLLRGMARGHIQRVQTLLKATESRQGDLLTENKEYKRQAAKRVVEAEEAVRARVAAEEAMRVMREEWEGREVRLVAAERRVLELEMLLEEQQQVLESSVHDAASLREEGQELRTALTEAEEKQTRLEELLAVQNQGLQQATAELAERREDVQRLLDGMEGAEAAIETSRHREEDALERLKAAGEEVSFWARRAVEEEGRRGRMEEWMMQYLEKERRRKKMGRVWQAWRWETVQEKTRKLNERLRETEARLCLSEGQHQGAEERWQGECLGRERLANQSAVLLDQRARQQKARMVLVAWRMRAREMRDRRRDLHNYLKQFVLRKRLAAAHVVAEGFENKVGEFSRALEEAMGERKGEREAAALELAEARAAVIEKEQEVMGLKERLEREKGMEEQVRAREVEVAELQQQLEEFREMKQELDEEVHAMQQQQQYQEQQQQQGRYTLNGANEVAVGGGEQHQYQEEKQQQEQLPLSSLLVPSPAAGDLTQCSVSIRASGSSSRSAVAFLVVRARRAEKEKLDLAHQLGEAREDVRRLSGELEEMMAMLEGGRKEGWEEGMQRQAEVKLTDQLERAHATIKTLEIQVGEARREAEVRETELVGALEDVETLEEHLTVQNEAVRQLEETGRVLEEELGRMRAAGKVREGRVVSLSRRIGLLEKERMESQTRYFERLSRMTDESEEGVVEEGGREGVEEEGGENTTVSSKVSPLLLAEVGRLQQALEESEEDRLTLEQQLVDVLREREELFGLCGLLRHELIEAATPGAAAAAAAARGDNAVVAATAAAAAPTTTTTTAATAAGATPTAASSSTYRQDHQPFFQPQTPTLLPSPPPSFPSSVTAAAAAAAAAADLAPERQRERETVVRSAQDLHWAVRRSQERLEYLLDEGCQVTEGLMKVGRERKGGRKGKKEKRAEELMMVKEEERAEEEERRRRRRKKEKKDKERHPHHHRRRARHDKHQAETKADKNENEEEEEGEEEERVGDGREELRELIQSTQQEVDAAAAENAGPVNDVLVDYLKTLKVSLGRLEGEGRGRGRKEQEEGAEEEVNAEEERLVAKEEN
eukprot:evm.model.NODE_9313_length_13718_cov_22.098047.1